MRQTLRIGIFSLFPAVLPHLCAGPVYTATIIAESGTPVAGVNVNASNVNNAFGSIAPGGNIVFQMADSSGALHLFTDIGGTVALYDPLGSGPLVGYYGTPFINSSGQVAYAGSPNHSTTSAGVYLGTSRLDNSVGGLSVYGLSADGTIVYYKQVSGNSNIYTQNGIVASGYLGSPRINDSDSIIWYDSSYSSAVVAGNSGLLVQPGSTFGGVTITNISNTGGPLSALGDNGNIALSALVNGRQSIVTSGGLVINAADPYGLAINGSGEVAWWDGSIETQYGVALQDGDVIDGQTVYTVGTVDGYAVGGTSFLDDDGDLLVRVDFTNGNNALVELRAESATPEPGTWSLLAFGMVVSGIWGWRRFPWRRLSV